MSKQIDMSGYTISETAEVVNVAEFRNRIEYLERLMSVDYHACADQVERTRWVRSAQRFARELTETTCKRATDADWRRRERALDRSATMIIRNSILR